MLVLEHAAKIAEKSTTALNAAQHVEPGPCDRAELDRLRLISFRSRFVRDILRLNGESVVCSATWDELSESFPLLER
ncbi:CSS-motif domain-containing protein [Stenotrophomonas maltophilia]|uniref:CSS-motif domain-containing protein n=1 Tax=Stenotrophomonas maltophilia TaxID=40324 RepID=UPI00115F61CC